MRVPFNAIWEVRNGALTNKVKISVQGITAAPQALKNYRGCFGGVDWSLFIGRELEVVTGDNNESIITGIY